MDPSFGEYDNIQIEKWYVCKLCPTKCSEIKYKSGITPAGFMTIVEEQYQLNLYCFKCSIKRARVIQVLKTKGC